ncbi:MAG TPA: 4-(cytidine 5'-diphospho)-2-C-methyl-D-erythritol kinase [Rhodobacteraceae bacterium]|nr:4-(cytidine 5'-diphospho)-2-C-methyl-D-erythritol kinase [Paracoccaceae bacterium]
MATEGFAPAKINLTLHVTGQRPDGYHLLDSLVVFAEVGDSVAAAPAEELSLALDGPEAGGLAAEGDNLVLRAARLLDPQGTAALTLTKRLPVASGIGGGSADAAAALRVLAALWDRPLPSPEAVLSLGADVPVCLAVRPCRMSGVGETLAALPPLPPLDILLVNPRLAVSTPEVFARLARKDNPPMPARLPDWPDAASFAAWLQTQRNDLAAPARALCPEIGAVLAALEALAPLHAGMSGSGATCYALFPPGAAAPAAVRLRGAHPAWWVAHGPVL